MSDTIGDRKRELRRRMRQLRSSIDDPSERSIAIWSHVRVEPAVRAARSLMAFASVPGEPDSASFIEWCVGLGKHVVVPEADPSAPMPADPRSLDVVIAPGLAFTREGDRLGQGGGWYDRVLGEVGDRCTTIGVGFAVQVLDELPVAVHDVRLDVVITEQGRVSPLPG
jgi:5-formyltetrahydrofolate cyclo-ligase